MTRFPDFAASEVVTDTKMDQLAVDYILKTADESVTSSATLQDDNELLFTVGATGTYIFDVYLWATSAANAAGDLQFAFTFPTGTLHFQAPTVDTGIASGTIASADFTGRIGATSGVTVLNCGLSTSTLGFHAHGILVATATGTLRLQWAQFASNANASTVKAGSHMIVKRVA